MTGRRGARVAVLLGGAAVLTAIVAVDPLGAPRPVDYTRVDRPAQVTEALEVEAVSGPAALQRATAGHGRCLTPTSWRAAEGSRIPAGAIVHDASSLGAVYWQPLDAAFRAAAAGGVWTVEVCTR